MSVYENIFVQKDWKQHDCSELSVYIHLPNYLLTREPFNTIFTEFGHTRIIQEIMEVASTGSTSESMGLALFLVGMGIDFQFF